MIEAERLVYLFIVPAGLGYVDAQPHLEADQSIWPHHNTRPPIRPAPAPAPAPVPPAHLPITWSLTTLPATRTTKMSPRPCV